MAGGRTRAYDPAMVAGADGRAGTDPVARETYRHLRLMLVTLPVLIVVAIAACLVVYRGLPAFEDYALNLAGFFAIFVAFVPNTLASELAGLSPDERAEALFGLRASLVAVILVTAVFVVLEKRSGHWTVPELLATPLPKGAFLVANLLGAGFLGLVVVNGFMSDGFAGVHMVAAVLFFASLAGAVATQGWPVRFGGTGPGVPAYRLIVALMAAALVAAAALKWLLHVEQTLLILELVEIGLFAWFWFLEARRTWSPPPRDPTAVA